MAGDNLENLKKRLYTKGESFEERKERPEVSAPKTDSPPSYWKAVPREKKTKKIFLFSVLGLAAVLIALALYFLFFGTNIISTRKINLEVKGPTSVEGGKVTDLNISLENKNQTDLESADLTVDFPDNSFAADGSALTRSHYSLDKIKSGETVNKTIEAVFFGLENEEKKVTVTLEYRLADSNAIFAETQDFNFQISAPAVGLSLSSPQEVNSKQEMTIEVDAVSNAEATVPNLSLEMSYPAGFQFESADPSPSLGNNIWSLGDLASLQKKQILIKGFVEGEDLENKTFNADVGVLDESGAIKSYGSASQTVVIKKSPLNLSLLVNGQDLEENVVKPGASLNAEVDWLNNLPVNVREAVVEVKLEGAGLNEDSISSFYGSYNSQDKKITWNSSDIPDLSSLSPGATGQAQFGFGILNSLPVNTASDKNFSVNLEATISGISTSDQGQNLEVTNDVKKEIKISSPLDLTAVALYYTGAFKNSGPLPPQVNKETTYTVVWSLSGNTNDFSKVKVTAALPSYVKWLNVTSATTTGEINFDQRNNFVTWNVGDLPAGTGAVLPARQVSFQISFTPSPSQKGDSPDLVEEANLQGYDNFVGSYLNSAAPALNTILNFDEQFKYGQGRVQ